MKWVSFSGEFAFLSIGGTAQGIIAIGGVAHGIVAIGGIFSVGVISIGMNAVGSVAALGMNAAAPISISLINGVGAFTVAGVNGWGTWTHAGTNATGFVSHGGVNSDHSIVPALVVIVGLLVASFAARGTWERRKRHKTLIDFLRSERLGEPVTAGLAAVQEGSIELVDGSESVVAELDVSAQGARAIAEESSEKCPQVLVKLTRVREEIPVVGEVGYREIASPAMREVIRCLDIRRAPARDTWLPKDPLEVRWVLAWTARISAVGTVVLLWLASDASP